MGSGTTALLSEWPQPSNCSSGKVYLNFKCNRYAIYDQDGNANITFNNLYFSLKVLIIYIWHNLKKKMGLNGFLSIRNCTLTCRKEYYLHNNNIAKKKNNGQKKSALWLLQTIPVKFMYIIHIRKVAGIGRT